MWEWEGSNILYRHWYTWNSLQTKHLGRSVDLFVYRIPASRALSMHCVDSRDGYLTKERRLPITQNWHTLSKELKPPQMANVQNQNRVAIDGHTILQASTRRLLMNSGSHWSRTRNNGGCTWRRKSGICSYNLDFRNAPCLNDTLIQLWMQKSGPHKDYPLRAICQSAVAFPIVLTICTGSSLAFTIRTRLT